jgi:hypothetical protein
MTPADRADEYADELIPARVSLVGRLKNWEDEHSGRQFFDTYWRLIYRVARKAGLKESAQTPFLERVNHPAKNRVTALVKREVERLSAKWK